jgi:hypothetical protein
MSAETSPGSGPETTPETDHETESAGGRVVRIAIAIVFALFFAYILFGAISSLIQLPADLSGTDIDVPWWVLIVAVVIPPAVYTVAFRLSRRFELFAQVLIFAVALATAYALLFSINGLGTLLIYFQL